MDPMTTLALLALSLLPHAPALAGDSCTATVASSTGAPGGKDIVTTAVEAGSFQTLAAALGAAGLVETLKGPGPFTVFAPSDEAFAKLPKGTVESLLKPENKAKLVDLLTYHVVGGRVLADAVVKLPGAQALNGQRLTVDVDEGGVRIAGVKLVATDIACSNGVIHVLDAVLMPATKNLVELAQGAGTFQTLLAAAQAAGLAETLATGGPFTLLAPNDEAFAKLPKGTLESLLEPANKAKLAGILKAHVIQGRVFSDQVAGLSKAATLGGAELAIQAGEGALRIGGARVLKADLQARNGVVHVIDTVIVPH
jgi:uncharacterized surface protein with fasciclin (FAS1) repeats